MVYLVFDSADLLTCITENWPMARSALDCQVAKNEDKPPRLEIHAAADYGLDLLHGVNVL